MSTPQDPRTTPLQDDEAALARVLRALPAGEPPAALDAAILKAATDAIAAPPAAKRPRRLPTWALGTAAAAVLAIGIGTQLRPPMPAERGLAPAEPQRQAVPAPEPEAGIDLPPATDAVLPAAPVTAERAAPAVSDLAPPPPAPSPPPPPPPAFAPSPAPAGAPLSPATKREPATAPAPAEALAPPPPEEDATTLDSIEVTGSRIAAPPATGSRESDRAAARAAAAEQARAEREADDARRQSVEREAREAAVSAEHAKALPPVADDARLAPADWLARIRERRDAGDLVGARASLVLLLRAHPGVAIPDDLAGLRE